MVSVGCLHVGLRASLLASRLWVREVGSDLNPIHLLAFVPAFVLDEEHRGHVADLPISPC